jgi:hypothetical protein
LQAPVAALERREVVLDLEKGANQRLPEKTTGRRPRASTVLAIAVAAALGIGVGQLSPMGDQFPLFFKPAAPDAVFRAKSVPPASSGTRWAGIQAFHLTGAGSSPERIQQSVRQEDGLLFAYTNLGSEPFQHLMIFCVDAEREVHWFFPAYATASLNPTSIPIQPGQELALSEVVWLSLPRGPLTIYAAFTRRPLDVASVEAWLKANPAGGSDFAGSDAVVTQLAVRVD